MDKLTIKEKATSYETLLHILQVQKAIHKLVVALIERGRIHDKSKLASPEVEVFAKYTDILKDLTYDSDEYKECLKNMDVGIQHHYANNRHHPEHHPNGVNDMNLVDLVEMLADWVAASKRQHNGNIRISLEKSVKRFKIDPQLAGILKNTIDLLEDGGE